MACEFITSRSQRVAIVLNGKLSDSVDNNAYSRLEPKIYLIFLPEPPKIFTYYSYFISKAPPIIPFYSIVLKIISQCRSDYIYFI